MNPPLPARTDLEIGLLIKDHAAERASKCWQQSKHCAFARPGQHGEISSREADDAGDQDSETAVDPLQNTTLAFFRRRGCFADDEAVVRHCTMR